MYQVGDEVFGEAGLNFGAHAEFVCIAEDGVILPKPEYMSFADACALCDGPLTSYNFLKRMGQVRTGQHVLVNGASGALGTAAVQLAKSFGAHVTAVCSASNADLVRPLGADEIVDYHCEDFATRRGRYDLTYDTVGKSSNGHCKKALTSDGTFLSPVLSIGLLLQVIWTAFFAKRSAKFDATGMRKPEELWGFLSELLVIEKTGQLLVCYREALWSSRDTACTCKCGQRAQEGDQHHRDAFRLVQCNWGFLVVDCGKRLWIGYSLVHASTT